MWPREWGRTPGKGAFNLRTGKFVKEGDEDFYYIPERDILYPGDENQVEAWNERYDSGCYW